MFFIRVKYPQAFVALEFKKKNKGSVSLIII